MTKGAGDASDDGRPFGPIVSGRAALDKSHEFVTDNPVAAAAVIAQVAGIIESLSKSFEKDIIRLALSGEDCLLMLPSNHDFFELPNIYLTMTEAKIVPLLSNFTTLLEIAKLASRISAAPAPTAEAPDAP